MKAENLMEYLNGYEMGYKDYRKCVLKIIERMENKDLSAGQLEILDELKEEMKILKEKKNDKKNMSSM